MRQIPPPSLSTACVCVYMRACLHCYVPIYQIAILKHSRYGTKVLMPESWTTNSRISQLVVRAFPVPEIWAATGGN